MKRIIMKNFVSAVAVIATLCCSSCSREEEEYRPGLASSQFVHIAVILSDENGQNILDDTNNLKGLKVVGQYTGDIRYTTLTSVNDKPALSFPADFPNGKDVTFSEDELEGEGFSTVSIVKEKRKKVLNVKFKYTFHPDFRNMYGGNGVVIESVTVDGVTVKREGNTTDRGEIIVPVKL